MPHTAPKPTQPVILKAPRATEGSHEILRCAQDDNVNKPADRLASAIFFANELSDSRLRKNKITYMKRWSGAARAKKAKLIQIHKPWRYACGPKTAAGKLRSCQNARIHDPIEQALDRNLHCALALQKRYIAAVNKRRLPYRLLHAMGALATEQLTLALAHLLHHDMRQGRPSPLLQMLRLPEGAFQTGVKRLRI